ncbi:hypothetical protein NEFER03_1759 [Nematocida sp. LUAm3]|nr:hypothetical protein NEFER03_1759 [Nematocida sp. LUAm3]KAI5173934.1 hypothetical protein NEFER02_0401 [Nematocida sp. LUAm2]KAI5177321.1 hypothetical protein NEFER01_0596 [Nematocida sp. LUAm1]
MYLLVVDTPYLQRHTQTRRMSFLLEEERSWRDLLYGKMSKQIKRGNINGLKKELLRHRIDASSVTNKRKSTLLHVAAKYNRRAMFRYLLRKGCWLHEENEEGVSPFYLAFAEGSDKVIKEIERIEEK